MKRRGAVLFETLFWVSVLVAALLTTEIQTIRLCNHWLGNLQRERLPYTGRKRW